MGEFPLIEPLKPFGTAFNEKYFLRLSSDTPFGNFTLTYSEIVIRIEFLNSLIITLYKGFDDHRALVVARGGW
jgi:hypothetical protein